MNNDDIYLTKHFKERYKERVSKSQKRAQEFANEAYYHGESYETIKSEIIRISLRERQKHGGVCKIYRGFICWFEGSRAVTVYPISKNKAINY